MKKVGLAKAEIPEKQLHIAIYSLMLLDGFVQKACSVNEVIHAIHNYPEDTHNEGYVCNDITQFVACFPTFEMLKIGIEQQFSKVSGRTGAESYRDSMKKLESWNDS
jgi:hypothetical protein